MRVRIPDYARLRMVERKITGAEIEATIYNPSYTRPGRKRGRTVFGGFQGTRKIEVVAEQGEHEWVVVSLCD